MGGKNKQRTKGNVRPSSSGRAAELLAKESGTVPGFIGFGAAQNDLGYVPAVQGAEEIDSLVDADFRMVLRKLSKRDVTTKLKAMQEFGAMCKERDQAVVKGVLPYWPRNYCRISLDHDRRVREATQQAFEQLILKVKKELAPHLKNLMGYWLIAQCDTYSPAASAAKVAFEAAFPPNKQPEALSFCKEEIIAVLQDNLLKETPDTLSDPQNVPEEEREAKYCRIVTSSLLALKKLLCMLPSEESNFLEEKLPHLLSQSKFWKYSKHKSPQVRAAFFKLISTFCQKLCGPLTAEAARVCPAVLLNVDESDAVVCPALWESVLYIITSIQDCWNHVSAKKGVLPKLWIVLWEGGRGLATVVYPYLLPFISKLPREITDPSVEFYTTYFNSMIQGLSSERAITSHSECSAVITAFMECLRFIMLQNLGEDDEQKKLRHMLIHDQLMPLIETALKDGKLQSSPLFYQVADTMRSWEAKADVSKDGNTATTLRGLLAEVWENLAEICVTQVDETEAGEKSLAGVSDLLQILNPEGGCNASTRKKNKIRFADDVDYFDGSEPPVLKNEVDSQAYTALVKSASLISLSSLSKEPLENLICKLAELSMVYIGEQCSDHHLKFLSALLSSFPSRRVFRMLLDQADEDHAADSKITENVKSEIDNPAIQFLHQKLVGWLKEDFHKETDFLVDILYSILHCCSCDAERKHMLDDLTKMDLKWITFFQIIQKACADSAKYSLVSNWLKGGILGEKLATLADELCDRGLEKRTYSDSCYSERWALLSLVLSQHVKNESLIGEDYVTRIIDKLHATLSKARDLSESGNIEPSVSFICDVASNFFSSVKGCLLMSSAEDLLLTIFQLCSQSQELTHLTGFLLSKLQQTWLLGFGSLIQQLGSLHQESTFLCRSAAWVKNQVVSSSHDVKSLHVLLSAVTDLLKKMLEGGQLSIHLVESFMGNIIPSDQEWKMLRESLSVQWINKPLQDGRLSLNRSITGAESVAVSSARLPNHLCASSLLSKMAFLILEQELFESSEQEKSRIVIIFLELLYSLQWCEELENPPSVLGECIEMFAKCGISHTKLVDFQNKLPKLLRALIERSTDSGLLWSLSTGKFVQTNAIDLCDLKPYIKSAERFFPITEGNLHTVQSLSQFLPSDVKEELMIQCIARLMVCTQTDVYNTNGGFGYLAIINSCLDNSALDCTDLLTGLLKIILSWKQNFEEIFLFSSCLKETTPQHHGLNIEIIRSLSLIIKQLSSPLADEEWDFILCSMLAWLETISENSELYHIPLIQLLAGTSCCLASTLTTYFQDLTPARAEKLPVNLLSEWKLFFSEGIHSLLLPLMVKIAGECKCPSRALLLNSILASLGEVLTFMTKDQLLDHRLNAKFIAGQKTNLPDKLQTLLNTLVPFLLLKSRPIQITVYHLLFKVMPELPQYDGEDLKSYGDEEEEPSLSPPASLMSILATQEDLIANILEDIPVGEFAIVQPSSEEFCYVLGYLLTWKLVLTFFKAASPQLRVLYSQYLRRSKSLNKLLHHLFKLMPQTPCFPGQMSEGLCKDANTFFTEDLQLSVKGTTLLSSEIAHLACSVYRITLKDLPAMVRLWWNGCEKRIFSVVDKFTSKYVSGVLSAEEIASVQTSTQLFDGMPVKARSATREVIATYTVDDIFIELIIQLPPNYPLGSITIESGKRVGVAVQQWRNWMLQLSTYLMHQNGSIMEGLALWKHNVDKRFEGVEDCMICFSVIHGSNYSLPKKACRKCKKKFHSACLYTWFTSSNKSTCPLCRETFF
ncbi:E3 ubiquitin-protein ligase listerin [Ambystoma mexicanum]|uniref:E3 ubiquitin-protein ligase listerin n=1 Tax=Ambystoma mexicanum TaxID=8296 RepID=UPI0037E8F3C1